MSWYSLLFNNKIRRFKITQNNTSSSIDLISVKQKLPFSPFNILVGICLLNFPSETRRLNADCNRPIRKRVGKCTLKER